MSKRWSWSKVLVALVITLVALAALPAASARQSFARAATTACQVGMTLSAGESCRYVGTSGSPPPTVTFSVRQDGTACREGGPIEGTRTILGQRVQVQIDQTNICVSNFERDATFGTSFTARRNSDGSWTVTSVPSTTTAPAPVPTQAPRPTATSPSAAPAPPAASAQQAFGHGAVVALQGTPHLWIADEQGTLHWGGDTRALAGKHVNWGDRTEVGLDQLRTLPVGDPWLSAGLLKDGDPIYLVKWESDWAQPQLLHIQSIADVELFGINGSNYGNFVLDKATWESRYGMSAAGLQRGVLASAVPPAATATPLPQPQPPPKVQSSNVRRRGDSVEVSWSAVPGATYYRVHYCHHPGHGSGRCNRHGEWWNVATSRVSASHTHFRHEGIMGRLERTLDGRFHVFWRVEACNDVGCSGFDPSTGSTARPQPTARPRPRPTQPPTSDGTCRVGLVVKRGESCTHKDQRLRVDSAGRVHFLFFTAGGDLRIRNSTINGVTYTLVTSKNADGSRTIVEIG